MAVILRVYDCTQMSAHICANLGGTAGKLYSCPNWDGSFLFSRTFNLYVEAIIMAYGMTARHSRHNALLNKIQAVGQWNVPRRT